MGIFSASPDVKWLLTLGTVVVFLLTGCGTPHPYISAESGPRAQVRITKSTSAPYLEVWILDANDKCHRQFRRSVVLKRGVLSQTVFVPAGRSSFVVISRGYPGRYKDSNRSHIFSFMLDDNKEYSIEYEAKTATSIIESALGPMAGDVKVFQYPSIPVELDPPSSCERKNSE